MAQRAKYVTEGMLKFVDALATERKHQRVGQIFCNLFSVTDSELFYEEDPQVAYAYIMEHYIELLKD